MRDSQFDFSDTSRTQKYFVAVEFWTEFLATSSSGSKFLVGELGGVAGVTAIHLFDMMVRIQQQQPPPASGSL